MAPVTEQIVTMAVTKNQIQMALENLPRFKLSHLNTPLETLERLKQDLSERGISTPDRILIKREDATGLVDRL